MIFFIDTTTNKIRLALLNNSHELIDKFEKETNKNMTDLLVEVIQSFLNKNNVKELSMIDKIYVVNGPGSFTSIKLSSIIANLIKNFYSKIRLYYIDSCSIQRAKERCICVVDARGNKYYAKLFLKQKESKIIIADKNELEFFSKKFKIEIVNSISKYDIVNSIKFNLNNFKETKKISPNYVKKAV